ncbi:ribosomal-protein-alanine N-acetyltransferase [Salinibacillus kushneri]|uniref:Ribosomal-protein-alanine N-acetyltransferase n=1 Tax=Salinibacillus kushneri TaxID=237682 RepID=A0A1I0F4W1_9BACI|nr:GNAT family protein [Salinibacillus kushneri]SET52857.1 ribosomal-protein-alanine N-acetyltransferase [Salinibacillus kushneri]
MTYQFDVMTQEQAEHIAYKWHYDGIYSFYDMEADQEDLAEFLDSNKRGYSMFAVTKENDLVGFFSANQVGEDNVDIGFGMRPDLTGRGYGYHFLQTGLEFVIEIYHPKIITLSVATFNQRAIKLYKKLGFKEVQTFMQNTNGGEYEFLKMDYTFGLTENE